VPLGSINYNALPILKTNNTINMEIQYWCVTTSTILLVLGGIQGNINASESMEQTTRVDLYENDKPTTLLTTTEDAIATSNSFTNFKAGLFDLTVGAAQVVQVQECDMW
jgi:hypothetical protein